MAPVAAQESINPASTAIVPIITGPTDVGIGRTLILDGSSSKVQGENIDYRWLVGDSREPVSRGLEMVYTPERPGRLVFRLVIRATIDGVTQEEDTSYTVTAYKRKIILLTDTKVPQDKIAVHERTASRAGIFLKVIRPSEATLPLNTEDELFNLVKQESETFGTAESIVVWTEGISGLQAMMRVTQEDPERLRGLAQQTVILITDGSLTTIGRTVRGPFSVLRPQRILLTRPEAMNPLFETSSEELFREELAKRDIDLAVVDGSALRFLPWNFLSPLVNYMLTHGVSSQTIVLLLVLPVIATILAFLKQIIGITTFGLFTPSIVALSFLALGWPVGILFLVFILATGYITRAFMRRWRLLYIPKVAIIITVVSVTLLLLVSIGAYLGITVTRDTVFVLLVMSTLAESFLNLKTEEGWTSALLGIGETIVAALLCVFIVQSPIFQSIILAYPELIVLTIPINLFLGKWTGLRLVEFFRFREVFRHLQEEQE
jgi:hypothetical protein